MLARARDNNFDSDIRHVFNEFDDESAEVRFQKNRLEAVGRVLIDEIKSGQAEEVAALKELFSDQLRSEIKTAAKACLDTNSFDPLHTLYREERSTFHSMVDIALAVAKDVNGEKISAELTASFKALTSRVDHEQISLFAQEAKSILADEGDILAKENARRREDLAQLKLHLVGRQNDLEQILKAEVLAPASPLVAEIKKPDPEAEEKMKKQVEQTQDFLKH